MMSCFSYHIPNLNQISLTLYNNEKVLRECPSVPTMVICKTCKSCQLLFKWLDHYMPIKIYPERRLVGARKAYFRMSFMHVSMKKSNIKTSINDKVITSVQLYFSNFIIYISIHHTHTKIYILVQYRYDCRE